MTRVQSPPPWDYGGRNTVKPGGETELPVAENSEVVAPGLPGKLIIDEGPAAEAEPELEHELEIARGPYAHLPPPRAAAPGKPASAAQKKRMRTVNQQAHEGKLIDDYTGEELVPPAKSTRGVTPPPNEAQVDHRIPASCGGDNSYANLRVTSRRYNRRKSARMPRGDER